MKHANLSSSVTSCVMAIMGSASAMDSFSTRFAAFGCVFRSAPSTIICSYNMLCLCPAAVDGGRLEWRDTSAGL